MEAFFIFIRIFMMPVLGTIFCLNLVTIIKKVKKEGPTAANTFWLTVSFILITRSTAITPIN